METLLAFLCLIAPLVVTQGPPNDIQIECKTGLWGSECQFQCGWCYRNGGCFRKDGTCYDKKCEDDWTGDKCIERCPPRTYGPGCAYKCPLCFDRCNASGCNERGCVSGRVGRYCQGMCPKNRFGPNCVYWCSAFCRAVNYTLYGKRRRCHPVTGECLDFPLPDKQCRTLGKNAVGAEAHNMNSRCIDNGFRSTTFSGTLPSYLKNRVDDGRAQFQKTTWKACNEELGRDCDKPIPNQSRTLKDGKRPNLIRDIYSGSG